MLIGYTEKNHNTRKQFLLHESKELRFRRVFDQASLQRAIRNLTGIAPRWNVNQFYRGWQIIGSTQITHLWNAVSSTRKPWVVTTSSGLPFGLPDHDNRHTLALEALAGAACKRIMYTSKFALEKIDRKISAFPNAPDIRTKLMFLPPPQEIVMEPSEKSFHDDHLHIAMVARFPAVKGGCELINAFARFIKDGATASLHIVGSPENLDRHVSPQYAARTRSAISSCPDMHLLGLITQPEVLDLFKNCHVSFLPSYRETYGYVVLESQACSCPVITTNIGAFPEINNDQFGWRVDLPDPLRHFDSITPSDAFEASMQLEDLLYKALHKVANSRDEIHSKATKAFHHLREQHGVAEHRAKLACIYTEALSGNS